MDDEPREPKPVENDPAIEPYTNGFNYPKPLPISEEDRRRYDEIARRIGPVVKRAKRRKRGRG